MLSRKNLNNRINKMKEEKIQKKKTPIVLIVILILIGIFLVYSMAYLEYRKNHIEKWGKDNKYYVIFPKSEIWIYYLFRPMSYIDGKFSDMRFHIGSHQEINK